MWKFQVDLLDLVNTVLGEQLQTDSSMVSEAFSQSDGVRSTTQAAFQLQLVQFHMFELKYDFNDAKAINHSLLTSQILGFIAA